MVHEIAAITAECLGPHQETVDFEVDDSLGEDYWMVVLARVL